MISGVKSTSTSFECVITSPTTSIANTIRRCFHLVPVYAIDIDELKIETNDSIFHNEKIEHRLELIPIRQSSGLANAVFEISTSFEKLPPLGISGYDQKAIVMSDNIRGEGSKNFLQQMPITELRPNQKLKITNIKLIKGYQTQHARHQSCIVMYKVIGDGKIKLSIKPCAIVGGISYPLDPIDCFKKSVGIILDMLNDFEKNLDNFKYEKLGNDLTNVIIENHTHTLGNLLQSQILQLPEFKSRFCAYHVPHPLKKLLIIKLTHSEPKKIFKKAIVELKKIYGDLLTKVRK